MKKLQKIALCVLIGLSCASAGLIHAQQAPVPATQDAMTDGEIKKVDMAGKKLTIKHGELKNLGMPAMTMVFRTKEPAMLEKVKEADKVRFTADNVNGALTVTSIDLAK